MPRTRRARKVKDNKSAADIVLLAFIFLGLGIGLAFSQAGAGLLVGAGLGIVARGWSKYGVTNQQLALSLGVTSYILSLFGFYLIFLGVTFIFGLVFYYPYAASVPLILLGAILLLVFFKKRR